MIEQREKISLRQALFLLITTSYTPSVRIISNFTASKAKQAGWLCPLVSFFFILGLFYVFYLLFKKHQKESYADIINISFGKPIGKVVIFIYILWMILLLGLYIRYYADRLKASIYPETPINLLILIMLILVAYILRSGILVLARMNQIIATLLTLVFIFLITLLIPQIQVKNLTPISQLDILPVMDGTIGVLGIWGYITFIFFIGNKIEGKDKVFKEGIKVSVFLVIISTLLIVTAIGILGYSVVQRAPLTFYVTVKQINALEIFQRIESLLITTWIISDFILIALYIYIVMELIKSLFNLKNTKPLLNIFCVLMYFIGQYISTRTFELQKFSSKIGIQGNIVFTFIIPVIVLLIGKLRKKI